MRPLHLVAITLLFVPSICFAQKSTDDDSPDLHAFSTEQLLKCFKKFRICEAESWDVADELDKRNNLTELMRRYWRERDASIRRAIEYAAYHVDAPDVTDFMREIVARKVNDDEERYYPVNYMAKKCDPVALRQLMTGRYRNQGSLQYATSVELFGQCQYRRAIPYLVGPALHDWSYNIIIAADHSLHALYPDGPKDFDDLHVMRQYFCDRAHQEGFRVTCGADDDSY
jgi:hypothetical protein